MALVCCLVAPTFAVYDFLNPDDHDNMSQRSSPIWQFFNKECLLCQKYPKDSGGNTSNLPKHITVHHSRNYQNAMINFHRKDTSTSSWTTSQWLENVFYRNVQQWSRRGHLDTVEANRHRLPSLQLRPQRQEVIYTMWLIDDVDTLTASTVTGTGQTSSPLAEAEPQAETEEETDLFLKTVAKTLWGLLCVFDNIVL